jgi:hypothetical protein
MTSQRKTAELVTVPVSEKLLVTQIISSDTDFSRAWNVQEPCPSELSSHRPAPCASRQTILDPRAVQLVGSCPLARMTARTSTAEGGFGTSVTAGRPEDDETVDPAVKNTKTAIGVNTTPSVRRAMRSLVLRRKTGLRSTLPAYKQEPALARAAAPGLV